MNFEQYQIFKSAIIDELDKIYYEDGIEDQDFTAEVISSMIRLYIHKEEHMF